MDDLTAQIGQNKTVFWLPSKEHVTKQVKIWLTQPMTEKIFSKAFLLSSLLRRGTHTYPNQRLMVHALEELFGAEMSTAISQVGSAQALLLTLQLPDERYIPIIQEDLLTKGLNLLSEMLSQPYLPLGLFDEDSFSQEKARLLAALANRRNQRARHAQSRLNELVFAGSPLAYSQGGNEEELKELTNTQLVDFYQETLKKSHTFIGLSGHLVENMREETLKEIFPWENQNSFNPFLLPHPHNREVKEYEEYLPGEQSQFFLAFTSQVEYQDPLNLALTLFNGLYGAFAHSRLFNKVREEKGLAYAVGSRFDRSTGVLTAYAGLNLESVPQAQEQMIKEIENLVKGDFSDDELYMTKETIIDQIKSMIQDVEGKMDFSFNRLFLKAPSPEALIQNIQNITRDEIKAAGATLKPHTAYLLADRKR